MSTRITASLLGAPIYLALILWPGTSWPFFGWPCALLTFLLVAVGLHEFYRGCRAAQYCPRDWWGQVAGALFVVGALDPTLSPQWLPLMATLWVMVGVSSEALRPDRSPLRALGPTFLGAVYVGWLFPFVLKLRLVGALGVQHLGWLPPAGWMAAAGIGGILLLFTVLTTVSVDSFAYFVGKSIGRRKLAPSLSPGKTVEGAIGGALGAVLVGALLAPALSLPLDFCLAAGFLVAVVAQLGDLGKSAVKREMGIKDFGSLIPGHGGVLDRFDSLIFTAPAVYWLTTLWSP